MKILRQGDVLLVKVDSLPLIFPDGEDDRPAAGIVLQVDRVSYMRRTA